MRSQRLPLGPLIAALGAVLLLVSLFLDWYGGDDGGVTAFTVFEALDLVLAALALAALGALVAELGGRLPAIGDRLRQAAVAVGGLALLIVLSQLLNEPPVVAAVSSVSQDEVGPDVGLWLALAGAALMLAGALLGAARVSLAVDRQPASGPAGSEAPTVATPPTAGQGPGAPQHPPAPGRPG